MLRLHNPISRHLSIALVALVSFATACTSSADGSSIEPDPAAASATAAGNGLNRKVEWVKVPAGSDPSAYVKTELERAKSDQKKLVLYVGAKWCEPCNHFHEATDRGELDAAFPDLRLVAFDHDEESNAIAALGCESKFIPMFSVPDAEGHCTRQQISGGIKGSGTVDYLAKKLRNLIGP